MKRFLLSILFVSLIASQAWSACVFNAIGTAGTAASGDVALGAPGSPQINDIWIAIVSSKDTVAHSFTDWTQVYNANNSISDTGHRFSVWYYRYTGTTPNFTVGHTAGDAIVGGIAQFRGCDQTGTPVDTLGTNTDANNDDTPTFNGLTPSTSNTLLLAVWGYNDNLTITTGPSGFTEGFSYTTALGADAGAHLYYKAHVSGATGDFGATMVAQGSNDDYVAMLIALGEQATAALYTEAPIIIE